MLSCNLLRDLRHSKVVGCHSDEHLSGFQIAHTIGKQTDLIRLGAVFFRTARIAISMHHYCPFMRVPKPVCWSSVDDKDRQCFRAMSADLQRLFDIAGT